MRFVHYFRTTGRLAFSGIKNNFLATVIAMGIVGLILFIFAVFLNLSLNVGRAIDSWKRDMGVVLYLQPDVSSEAIDNIQSIIRNREEIEHFQMITPEEGWEQLSRRIGLSKDAFQALGGNPLPVVFELRVKKKHRNLEITRDLAAFFSRIPGVDEVDYGQEWVERANRFFRLLETVLVGLCLLLGTASVFVIGNTIRLIILNRHEEIEILGLLGATPGFIAFPYLLEGLFLGSSGGAMAVFLAFLFYQFGIVPMFETFGFLGDLELSFLTAKAGMLIIISGGLIGLFGSGFSVKKYLPR